MKRATLFFPLLVFPLISHNAFAGKKYDVTDESKKCVQCHKKISAALVMEWEHSLHAPAEVGCYECHQANEKDVDGWKHQGEWISTLVTPKDCSNCHSDEFEEFSSSHHAKAGEILASLDNVLAEKVIGSPHNNADAANGCWQCHGSIVTFKKDAKGNVLRKGKEKKPIFDPMTWPNSGMGRLNPDGSKGSCHACHSRHDFNAKLARMPENCGKCHMGPDHPQIEIYNESKHGIAFHANRERMALDKDGEWILGKDYSAAPTCATCHISGYMDKKGKVIGKSHDVGERISWTLRPIISTRLNMVIFEDGFKEDYPYMKKLPAVGATVNTKEKVVKNDKLITTTVKRKVKKIVTWKERRDKMKAVCANCHASTHVENFYKQFDSLVVLYNDKFARPAKALMGELKQDKVLNPSSPFGEKLNWIFFELWHHEGRRARHGASMMGPDYTHWHGMYEVADHFYNKFLPEVVMLAKSHSPKMGKKYKAKVDELMAQEEHLWQKGLSKKEAEALRKMYQERYQEKH